MFCLKRVLLPALMLTLGAGGLRAAPYEIDHDHSAITFAASHLGYSEFRGRFTRFDAEIDFYPEAIARSSVAVTIDPTSFYSGSDTRDSNTITFDQLLNAGTWPEITFRSTRIVLTSAETARMEGALTLRGVTQDVEFNVQLNARGVTPLSGGREVFGFSATTEIDRTAFGMGFAAPAVSAVVPVRVDLEIFAKE